MFFREKILSNVYIVYLIGKWLFLYAFTGNLTGSFGTVNAVGGNGRRIKRTDTTITSEPGHIADETYERLITEGYEVPVSRAQVNNRSTQREEFEELLPPKPNVMCMISHENEEYQTETQQLETCPCVSVKSSKNKQKSVGICLTANDVTLETTQDQADDNFDEGNVKSNTEDKGNTKSNTEDDINMK